MKRAAALVLLGLVIAGCGGTSAPREPVGVFMTRILREELNGQWRKQWTELHPAHQKLISQAQYVSCSRGIGTDVATGKETFRVLDVVDDPIHVQDVPQTTSKLVTITVKTPGIATLTYRLHAVAVSGRWAWILGDRFIQAVDRGKCLDGSPLRG